METRYWSRAKVATTIDQIRAQQLQFFSTATISISSPTMQAMARLVAAIESVIALPTYQAYALAQATAIARLPGRVHGVFIGYDFHLTAAGPKLIEINTNAGGGLLNACLLDACGRAREAAALRDNFVAMFHEEWRRERGDLPLRRIAIIDQNPAEQFLAPEFALFKDLFEEHGIAAAVADPREFTIDRWQLFLANEPVDLIYNRLTDFSLDATANGEIRTIFKNGGVVITPNPRTHALYADKRNLILLSDDAALQALGVDENTRKILLAGIPKTVGVTPEQGESFWAERKRWFFKPSAGFGSRAVYRGDKLTKRVFEDILQGDYIAQEIAPPSEHLVPIDDGETTMKADIRCYVYDGHIQLVAARLYQGQTTNFRTPGGGFAPMFVE